MADVLESMTAASFLWSMFRSLEFTEADDDASIELWERACAKVRTDWPWLDGLSDAVERTVLEGRTIMDDTPTDEAEGTAIWVDEDGSAFLSPPS